MKKILLILVFFGSLSAKAQHIDKPIYFGKWEGVESGFKIPYAVIINDSNLLLIRKNLSKNKVVRIDTLVFKFKATSINNGYEFALTAPHALINQDKTLMARFIIEKQAKSPAHPNAIFSIDFNDGSKEPSTIKLVLH